MSDIIKEAFKNIDAKAKKRVADMIKLDQSPLIDLSGRCDQCNERIDNDFRFCSLYCKEDYYDL